MELMFFHLKNDAGQYLYLFTIILFEANLSLKFTVENLDSNICYLISKMSRDNRQ